MFRLNFKAKTVSNFVKRDFLNLTVYFALATKIQIESRLFPSVDLLSLKAINKSRLGNVLNVNKLDAVLYDVTGVPLQFFIESYLVTFMTTFL